ncbi:hypothetical protein EFP00_07695 [Lactiplantibacillus paraplantarum]|uniref:hypothetical protein n=1 Tax=Lactiplantibacillus paraplantarum TaxID=60520 RepID=UPI0021A48BB6|nr:hypothetical protein [Lactiplantibacillus paraplantarum]MCT4457312.1 hypothetical protein [Lactiplantibacillus paraplantarum]
MKFKKGLRHIVITDYADAFLAVSLYIFETIVIILATLGASLCMIILVLKYAYPGENVLQFKVTDVRVWLAFSSAFFLSTILSGYIISCMRRHILKVYATEFDFRPFFEFFTNVNKVFRTSIALTMVSGVVTNGFVFVDKMASQKVFSMSMELTIYFSLAIYTSWLVSGKIYTTFMVKKTKRHKGTYRHGR